MVNLVRLLAIALASLMRPRRGVLETSVIRPRVWPNDLDLNLHMNNGRYLSLMDLGRVDLMFHGGVGLWLKRGRQPLVAASFCRHFKPLGLFQSFELHTRVVGWDAKWVYFEQRFMRRGTLHALGAIKALVADPGRLVPTQEFLADQLLDGVEAPALPDWVRDWLKAERAAIDALKAERAAAGGQG
jgi:acyl-CoA thioesterase FadM